MGYMIPASFPFSPNLLRHIYIYVHRNWKNKMLPFLMFYPCSDAFSILLHSVGVLNLDWVCLWAEHSAGRFWYSLRRKGLVNMHLNVTVRICMSWVIAINTHLSFFISGFAAFAGFPFLSHSPLASCILMSSFALSNREPKVPSLTNSISALVPLWSSSWGY